MEGGVDIQLNMIYPNPAKAITVIPISSNRQQKVRIQLVNLQGEIVNEVYNGEITAGAKNFFIDASRYASGLYQVRIQTDEYEQLQKLIIEN
ncbi:T9SS type A sorting domain-containing protein [Crocinitomicaceae bacterium]|nr:T9SS type A sorting domain-containing protein [Crocinitomicaceae bacterium]